MPLLPAADYWRSRFPIFERHTYINSCSQGALSLEVRAAYDAYLADWDAIAEVKNSGRTTQRAPRLKAKRVRRSAFNKLTSTFANSAAI